MDEWTTLLTQLDSQLGVKPNELSGVLLLIGIHELGQGVRSFSKQEKMDLMHIALCKILSYNGYYQLDGMDTDGWPHWKLVKKVPDYEKQEQESFLKSHVISYFKINKFIK